MKRDPDVPDAGTAPEHRARHSRVADSPDTAVEKLERDCGERGGLGATLLAFCFDDVHAPEIRAAAADPRHVRCS